MLDARDDLVAGPAHCRRNRNPRHNMASPVDPRLIVVSIALGTRARDRPPYPTLPLVIIQAFDGEKVHENVARRGVGEQLRLDLVDALDTSVAPLMTAS